MVLLNRVAQPLGGFRGFVPQEKVSLLVSPKHMHKQKIKRSCVPHINKYII